MGEEDLTNLRNELARISDRLAEVEKDLQAPQKNVETGKATGTGEVLHALDQVVIKLGPKAQEAVRAANIPSKPARYVAEPVSRYGVAALDKVLKDLSVRSIRRIGRPKLTFSDLGETREAPDEVGVARTYLLRLDKGVDVNDAVTALKADKNVEDADLNYFATASVIPNDTRYPDQWYLPRINCPDAWDRHKGSRDVIVAVVDSGIDHDHPDLAGNLCDGYDFVDLGLPPAGWHWEGDVTGRDPQPWPDDVGHGTHVSGTISAVTNNGLGIAGVTWYCCIMPVRALAKRVHNTTGEVRGSGTFADIADGIKWAADNGAHVINMSLGAYVSSFVLEDAVNYAFARNCVLVAAAGNDSITTDHYPAAYKNVLAVGSTDITDTRSSFSNYGPQLEDGVVAPGGGEPYPPSENILSTVPNDSYAYYRGTSMAAPQVAGLAALLKSCDMSFSNTQIMDIIRHTARPLGGAAPNEDYGYGIIDAKAALGECPLIVKPPPFDLCKKYPWLPWCRPPGDWLCKMFPWICRPWQPPGPLPPGTREYGEGYAAAYPPDLDETERELRKVLRVIKKMRQGGDLSNLGSLYDEDCGCRD